LEGKDTSAEREKKIVKLLKKKPNLFANTPAVVELKKEGTGVVPRETAAKEGAEGQQFAPGPVFLNPHGEGPVVGEKKPSNGANVGGWSYLPSGGRSGDQKDTP